MKSLMLHKIAFRAQRLVKSTISTPHRALQGMSFEQDRAHIHATTQPAVGLQSVNVGVLPAFKRELQLNELQAACDARVHALVTVYHSDHRKLYAHERDWPFCIVNILELVGESMGLQHRDDRYKRLKMMQDVDQIVAE